MAHEIFGNDTFAPQVLKIATFLEPGAMIAGGYVRDTILRDAVPTDIDVYMPHRFLSAEQTAELFATMIKATTGYRFEVRPALADPGQQQYDETHFTVYKLELWNRRQFRGPGFVRDIDVIITGEALSPGELFRTFDIGLCEAAITSRGVTTSQRFEADVADHALTLRDARVEVMGDRHTTHLVRVRAKYPAYEIRRDGIPAAAIVDEDFEDLLRVGEVLPF